MIIAGEASGDAHGARVVSAMREKHPSLFVCGVGGPALREAGVKILIDLAELSVVGITEVLAKTPQILRSIKRIKKILQGLRPDLLVLVDFPDFNLHIAAIAKKHGVPVLYYISPTVWAWRAGRIHKIKRCVDYMALIYPFELPYYTRHRIPAAFVGHPILDVHPPKDISIISRLNTGSVTVGLLPGSRHGEIEKNLPIMLAAASRLHQRFPGIRFLLSRAPTVPLGRLETHVAPYRSSVPISLTDDPVTRIFQKSLFVVAVSGTVTLEAAIHCVPMIIVYRVSPLSYRLGRALIRVDHVGIVNIIAGRRIVPELIQAEATPAHIAAVAGEWLADPSRLEPVREALADVRDLLGDPGAAKRTAEIGLGMLHTTDAG